MSPSRLQWALRMAQEARYALSDLADVMDELGTEADRDHGGCGDAAHLINRAEEARGAARLLDEWMGHLRRLRSRAEDGAG